MAPSQGLGYRCLHQRAKTITAEKIIYVSRPLSFKRLRSTNVNVRLAEQFRNPLTGERGVQNPGVCLKEFLSFLPLPIFHFLALVLYLALPKPKIPFLGLSLLRNMTKTLASQLNLACPLPVLRPRPLCINRILSCKEASWNDCDKDLKSANLWSSG